MTKIEIAGRRVGPGYPSFIIAEVAQAHDGSLGAAHAYIDACADTGVDAVKFQTHFASEESTAREPWRVKFSRQDASRFDYWKRMEFPPEAWTGLAEHCREKNLVFLSSPFSLKAVSLLENLDMPAWKVASGEIANPELLMAMAKTKKPVLLSSGLANWSELDRAAGWVKAEKSPMAIFQTTTAYPCPPNKIGLNVLPEIRERYQCPVGLSDHSSVGASCVAATALGANLLEVHVVFAGTCFGPDTGASLSIPELQRMVSDVRHVETILQNPVDKNAMAEQSEHLRKTFGKSIVASTAISAGTTLTSDHLALKKPGEGLAPIELQSLLGKVLNEEVVADQIILKEMLR